MTGAGPPARPDLPTRPERPVRPLQDPLTGAERAVLTAAVAVDPDRARAAWEEWLRESTLEDAPHAQTRLLPAVYARLRRDHPGLVLPDKLRGQARATFGANVLRTRTALLALAAQDPAPPVLLLKGTALAAADGGWARRTMGDTDVLVPVDRLAGVVDGLLAAGWAPKYGMTRATLLHRAVRRRDSWNFSRPPAGDLDVHWRLFACPGEDALTAQAWATARATTLWGHRVLLPAPEVSAVLAVHHGLRVGTAVDRTQALADLAVLLPQVRPEAWWRLVASTGLRAEADEAVAQVAELTGVRPVDPAPRRAGAGLAEGAREAVRAGRSGAAAAQEAVRTAGAWSAQRVDGAREGAREVRGRADEAARRAREGARQVRDRADETARRARERSRALAAGARRARARTAAAAGRVAAVAHRRASRVPRDRRDVDLLARPRAYAAWEAAGRPARWEEVLLRDGPFSRPLAPGPARAVYDARDCAAMDEIAGPGWGWPEPEHTCFWSDRADARLLLPLPDARGARVSLGLAEHHRLGPNPTVDVYANGRWMGLVDQHGSDGWIRLDVPADLLVGPWVEVSLRPTPYLRESDLDSLDYPGRRSIPLATVLVEPLRGAADRDAAAGGGPGKGDPGGHGAGGHGADGGGAGGHGADGGGAGGHGADGGGAAGGSAGGGGAAAWDASAPDVGTAGDGGLAPHAGAPGPDGPAGRAGPP